jgi:Flp pilus assembly protein CpaB
MPPTLRLPLAVRRQLVLRRRLLAALVAAIASLVALRTTAPPPPPRVEVAVAAHDLPAGTVLGARDVELRSIPEEWAPPPPRLRPGELVGRVLAAPMRVGEAVEPLEIVGPELARASPGETVLPVRLPDPGTAGLLAAGDEVDLLATDPGTGTSSVLARDVRVVAVPAGAPPGPSGEASGALVVLAVADADVLAVTGASLTAYLSVAL